MCAVLQIRTRKFTICVDEVQYMLKKSKREALSQYWHSQSQLFGTKKDARSAKCVHLQHRTMTNAVRIGAQKQCTPVH